MYPRPITIFDHQRYRRRCWIELHHQLYHLFLMLITIGFVFFFDVCQSLPSPGLLNIPPTIIRGGNFANDGLSSTDDGSRSAISTETRSNMGAINDNNDSDLLQDIQNSAHILNLTRYHNGDVFRTNRISKCNADTCVGLSSGTAGLLTTGGDRVDNSHHRSSEQTRSKESAMSSCDCRCLTYLSTYREDLGICVDDIHECTLSPFVSGSSSEKIPFVFLPLRGQIIYPSREISFPNIRTPVCAVTGAQYLTANGWSDLRNPIDGDYPFRMFRDEGRTFIQWIGEPDLRIKMQGRLIVVHLVCRDMMFVLNTTKVETVMPPKNVFSSCVAFRVNGSPVKYLHNVSEVLFQAEATSTLSSKDDGMSAKEYIVIGVCSLLLGLIYVSSVFLYLYMKKRKSPGQCHMRNSLNDLRNEINYPKNDQVTFGVPFNRSGSIYSVTSISTSVNNLKRSRSSIGSPINHGHLKEEIGIVKNNPLLQQFPNLSDHHSGFTSDISNSNSECEMESTGFYDKRKQIEFLQTSALVHPNNEQRSGSGSSSNGSSKPCDQPPERPASPTQENECLPEENVSIVEDIISEDKFDSMRALVNGTVRKKLYFNPAYFEPDLLAEPPPAAIEFLTKIREVIAIAKYKMSAKRYQPSLIDIPEEGSLNNQTPARIDVLERSDECKGCISSDCSHTRNCGDKRNSIEKWLRTVPHSDNEEVNKKEQPQETENTKNKSKKSSCCRKKCPSVSHHIKKEMSPPKQRPPPPPVTKPSSSLTTPKKIFNPQNSSSSEITDDFKTHDRYTTDNHGSSPPRSVSMPKTTICVKQKTDEGAMTNGSHMYAFSGVGIEMHSNNKFGLPLDSPSSSQRSHASSHRSKSSRKRLEVLDQYTVAVTPTSLASSDRKRYEALRDMRQMSSTVYEAVSKDCNSHERNNHISHSFTLDIPTPDYDSTMEKKIKDIYNNTQSSAPSVPTPDYSTLSQKSLRQCQPDSPIYRRRSPQYLIVDYETDSLERLASSKRKSSQSSSSPSSDVSSQLSPSLSTALPLEEEVEIRHTIYDKIDGFRKDGDSDAKKKISSSSSTSTSKKNENGTTAHKEIAARIKYDTPFRGSMTIEVEHEPQSDLELSTDSDQFEPDTLDRKPKKHSFCDVNAWNDQIKKSQCFVNGKGDGQEQEHYASLNNTSILLNCNEAFKTNQQPHFDSKRTFHDQNEKLGSEDHKQPLSEMKSDELLYNDKRPTFGSLREIYQSRVMLQNAQRPKLSNCSFSEKGRLLTLEAKHSRRQQVMPPQVEPPTESSETKVKGLDTDSPPMLRHEFRLSQPAKINLRNIINDSKNSMGWNTNNQSVKGIESGLNRKAPPIPPKKKKNTEQISSAVPLAAEEETNSNHSESTDITGVSDTQANSEFEDSYRKANGLVNNKEISTPLVEKMYNQLSENHKLKLERDESENDIISFNSRLNQLRNDYSLNKYLNRKKSVEMDDDSAEDGINNTINSSKSNQINEEFFKIEANLISSRSNRRDSCFSDRTKEIYRNTGVPVGIAYPQRSAKSSTNSATDFQTVYRCEIVPVSNGMQIAMGLKDRAKKSKDLRNAWRKFVGMAASRFSPPSSYNKKASTLLYALEKDEGISSLIDDLPRVSSVRSTISAPATQGSGKCYEHRYGSVRHQEMDSGYMSADSSEVHNRRFYDRYNFKLMTGKDHIIRVDTIEDNSDGGGSSGGESAVSHANSCQKIKDAMRSSLENDSRIINLPENSEDTIDDFDAISDKTVTEKRGRIDSPHAASVSLYSSEDDCSNSKSYGSSETDEGEEEVNTDEMWESGAESVETNSVLYKNIRKSS